MRLLLHKGFCAVQIETLQGGLPITWGSRSSLVRLAGYTPRQVGAIQKPSMDSLGSPDDCLRTIMEQTVDLKVRVEQAKKLPTGRKGRPAIREVKQGGSHG